MSALVAANLAIPVVGLGLYAYIRFVRGWYRPATHGDSRWAQARDLNVLTARTPAGDRIDLGWMGRRFLQAPAEDNVLVFGVQRSGKTSTLAVPTLLTWRGAAGPPPTQEGLGRVPGRPPFGFRPRHRFPPPPPPTPLVPKP